MDIVQAFIRKISLLLRKPKVHLYALCWNDAKMLPYFFKHYDQIVDQYFIFDNGSTDESLQILQAHPRVTVGVFEVRGNSFVREATEFYEVCWKQSRLISDWVFVCNIDEFLYMPQGLRRHLRYLTQEKYTIIIPEGFEMVSDIFPSSPRKNIYEYITEGFRSIEMDKPQFFNPKKIESIHFAPGRHTCAPIGEVKYATHTGCKLLHFKYVGTEYWLPRQNELKKGLRSDDILNSWGHQYLDDDIKKMNTFQEYKRKSTTVL